MDKGTYSAHPDHILKLQLPADGPTFEDWCLVIYKAILSANAASFYGRGGQKQHGIDLVFELAGGRRAFVQCKNEAQLPVKKVRDALNAFHEKWGRSLASGDRFIFALRQDDSCVSDAIEDFRKTHKVEYTIETHSLRTLSLMVVEHESIWSYFFKGCHDTRPSEDVRWLTEEVGKNVAEGNLCLASRHFNTKKHEIEKDAEFKHPKFIRTMAGLYLAAGDFNEAYKLLNQELGFSPHSARVWGEYLRARRFRARFMPENPNKPFPLKSDVPEDFSKYVDSRSKQFLLAAGSLDEKLFLAYMALIYGEEVATQDDALRRGLGVLCQYWPDDESQPSAEERSYIQGALLLIYGAFRNCFRMRQDVAKLQVIESGVASSSAIRSAMAMNRLPCRVSYATAAALNSMPLTWQEINRSTYQLSRAAIWVRPHGANVLIDSTAVCTAETALVVSELIQRPEKLLISGLAMERLLCFSRWTELCANKYPTKSYLLESVGRIHSLIRRCGLARTYSCASEVTVVPVYYNLARLPWDGGGEMNAAIYLAQEKGFRLLLPKPGSHFIPNLALHFELREAQRS